jgi:hypothetical protein
MDENTRLAILENALAQMLKPIKGIPLNVIIKALSEHNVIRFDQSNPADARVLQQLQQAIRFCAEEVKSQPIRRPRPNEVGNDIEEFVIRGLRKVGLRPQRPTSAEGRGKSTGYPDILFYDSDDRPTYLECKIFAHGTDPSTMRSFYLSPSESFKVSIDARHLLLAYGMDANAVTGSRDSLYRPKSFKLVDLHDLLCDVKYEFNSDNRRLYGADSMLLQGNLE